MNNNKTRAAVIAAVIVMLELTIPAAQAATSTPTANISASTRPNIDMTRVTTITQSLLEKNAQAQVRLRAAQQTPPPLPNVLGRIPALPTVVPSVEARP